VVTRSNLSRILNGRAGISAAMSMRLAKAMPYTSPEFWLKMQLNYDLSKAQKSRQPKSNRFRPAAKAARLNHDLTFAEDGQQFHRATWLDKARELPTEDFRREVEKELTGKEEEPLELIYFKVSKSQIPVNKQAIEVRPIVFLGLGNCGSGRPGVNKYGAQAGQTRPEQVKGGRTTLLHFLAACTGLALVTVGLVRTRLDRKRQGHQEQQGAQATIFELHESMKYLLPMNGVGSVG
jgi:hypothetical protein